MQAAENPIPRTAGDQAGKPAGQPAGRQAGKKAGKEASRKASRKASRPAGKQTVRRGLGGTQQLTELKTADAHKIKQAR
eukprot:5911104-Alexandrium_andersonii.AAC.1